MRGKVPVKVFDQAIERAYSFFVDIAVLSIKNLLSDIESHFPVKVISYSSLSLKVLI